MQSVQHRMSTARQKEMAGDLDGAAGIYEGILEHAPDHVGALHALGALMNRPEGFERAKELLERAVVLRPGDPVRHVDLEEKYRHLGAHRKAIGCCRVAMRLYPECAEGLVTLGLALQGAGDLRGALEEFRRAIAYRENFSPPHTNAGMVLRELGLHQEAVASFERAVEIDPDSPLARTNLGLALLECGRVAEAVAQFREAVSLQPDSAVVRHDLGNGLRILGRLDDALASYQEAIRLDPGLVLSYLHIGQILDLQGSRDAALKWNRLAVEMELDNREAPEDPAALDQARDAPSQAAPYREKCWESSATDDLEPMPEPCGSLREFVCSGEAPVPMAEDTRPDWHGDPNSSANVFAGAGCRELRAFDQELGVSWASVGPDNHPAVI